MHLFDEKKGIKRGRFEKEFEELLKKVVVTSDLKLFIQHLSLISRNSRKNYITAENKFEIGFERERELQFLDLNLRPRYNNIYLLYDYRQKAFAYLFYRYLKVSQILVYISILIKRKYSNLIHIKPLNVI